MSNHLGLGFCATATALALLAAGSLGAAQAQDKKVRWKNGSSYASSLDVIGENIKRWHENVDAMSGGSIDARFYEPGALVPALQVFDAVSQGSIDMSYTTSGFHAGKLPAAAIFSSLPFGPSVNEYMAWMRHGGGEALRGELYGQYGVISHTCGIVVAESSGWFRKEIKSIDDLKGLKMRFFGLGAKVMEKFGVSTQLLAGGDIYPALELGTIDATEFSYPSLDRKLGFHQVAKFNYFPGWHQQASFLENIYNKANFEGTTKAQQKIMEIACGEANVFSMAKAEATQGEAVAFHESKGVQIKTWGAADLEKFKAAWEEVAKEEADKDPLFKKFYESYTNFRATYAKWRAVAYLK